MKSETRFGDMLEQYLPLHFNECEAYSAEYSDRNQHIDTYESNKYDLEHLIPKNQINQSRKHDCCTGSDGEPKQTYSTKSEAHTEADYIYYEREVDLKVYKCRNGDGWHLTKIC
jgi:hypothetical protein